MTKQTEALKLAFKQAFDLGQTYWSWADSEYQSHWKKADAAKERFNQLVEDAIREILAEQQTDWEAVAADQALTIALLKAEQPAQPPQEPDEEPQPDGVVMGFTDDGKAIVDHDGLEEGCVLYTSPPAQRKPEFKEFIKWAGAQGYDCAQTCNSDTGEWIALNPMTADLWKAWQAAHGIKGDA